MGARWLCCLANLNSLISGQSCSPVMPLPASTHFLPLPTSCLHPLPASIHFLPPSTSCLRPLPAFIHFLPSSTCFSTYRRLCSVQPVQHILLQRVLCMEHLIAKQNAPSYHTNNLLATCCHSDGGFIISALVIHWASAHLSHP
jgi:hypothetical protein